MLKVRLRQILATYWPSLACYGGLLALFGGLLWLHLGTLPHGYSAGELQTMQASSSLSTIFHHPLNAPFTLLTYLLLHLRPHSLLMVRVASGLFGLGTLTLFYWLVRYWHGQRSAVLGTVLFGASAWFLHAARLGVPDVLLFSLVALVACCVWLKKTNNPAIVVACLTLVALLLYVPGMVWLLAIGAVWQWKVLDRIFKNHLWMVSLGALIVCAALAPLGLAIYHSPDLAKELVGLPTHGWPQALPALHALAEVPVNLFGRGPFEPERWLGHLPVIDAFTTVMFALGGYLYVRHLRLVRVQLVGALIVTSAALICLGGDVTLTLIVPFIYLVASAGMGFMLDRWFKVFPRNMIAEALGVVLLCAAVFTSAWYGVQHYFVAWPTSPDTKAVFIVPASDTMKR